MWHRSSHKAVLKPWVFFNNALTFSGKSYFFKPLSRCKHGILTWFHPSTRRRRRWRRRRRSLPSYIKVWSTEHLSDIALHKFCTTSHPEFLENGEKQQQLSGKGTVILPRVKKKPQKLRISKERGLIVKIVTVTVAFPQQKWKGGGGDEGLGFV